MDTALVPQYIIGGTPKTIANISQIRLLLKSNNLETIFIEMHLEIWKSLEEVEGTSLLTGEKRKTKCCWFYTNTWPAHSVPLFATGTGQTRVLYHQTEQVERGRVNSLLSPGGCITQNISHYLHQFG